MQASEATWKAVAGFFEGLDLGEVEVKGHTPVKAVEVLRPRGRRSRLEVAAEHGLTPLVGREREVGVLLDLFREAKAGRGQVALVNRRRRNWQVSAPPRIAPPSSRVGGAGHLARGPVRIVRPVDRIPAGD